MAERRMISRSIAEDDRFVDMNPISKLLYFYLVLNADDDGFVGSVKMINFLMGANADNYEELLDNNLILKPTQSGVYVITDWYSQNKIEGKIYKPTEFLSIRALLYIKTNFAYTLNPSDDDVMAPVNAWIKNGRDKKTSPEIQLQQYSHHFQETSKKVPGSVEEISSKLLAQNRIDKSRLDKSRVDKTRKDQVSKDQHRSTHTATTTSNKGLGKDSSSSVTSTSTMYNNATSASTERPLMENRLAVNDEIESLFDSLNREFNSNIPYDDQRLVVIFTDLLNKYKIAFVQKGISQLASIRPGQSDVNSIKNLVVNHLSDAIEQVTVG